MAYDMVEPFGDERADLRAGIIASTVANALRDPKKHRPFKPQDFMPVFGPEGRGQSWEDQLAVVEVLNRLFGGKDLRASDGDDSRAGDSSDS